MVHWKLALFLFFSFVLHAFCFYLFQVVYPPSERFTPNPARITYLSAGNSSSRGQLTALEDRVVYFDSSGIDSAARTRIEDYTVEFKPSFAGFAPNLRGLPERGIDSPLPATINFQRTDLPAPSSPPPAERLSTRDIAGGAGETGADPRMFLEGKLEGRSALAAGDWEWALEAKAGLEGRHAILMLAIDEEGAVQHALIHRGIESGMDAKILTTVRGLRFEAAPGGGLSWGMVRLEW